MAQRTFLVDTNVLLCALIAPERLSADTQAQLVDAENMVYFSAASVWEIAIKRSMGKANFDFLPDDIYRLAIETGFTQLAIDARHTYAVANMAWHHRDPFDRLLIAQAVSLPAYFMTGDSALAPYSELVLVVPLKAA